MFLDDTRCFLEVQVPVGVGPHLGGPNVLDGPYRPFTAIPRRLPGQTWVSARTTERGDSAHNIPRPMGTPTSRTS
jgi:hypothetical protein